MNGLNYNDAKAKIISEIEKKGIGHGTTNYRQRDAIFSRQRYWGEPVPVYYEGNALYFASFCIAFRIARSREIFTNRRW
ncbi:MAG: hypothetical protein U0T85_08680 [Cloacibacterium normanense]